MNEQLLKLKKKHSPFFQWTVIKDLIIVYRGGR